MTEKKAATETTKRDDADPAVEPARTPEEEEALRERLQKKAEAARIIVVRQED